MSRTTDRWFRDYSLFLKSSRWRTVRAEVLARDGYRCVYCNDRAVQVHHRSYIRLEDPALLVSVCVSCHSLLHRRTLTNPRQRDNGQSSFCRRCLAMFFRFLR
jgi:5-methylcytosine-specific restriction endonuclease McrA